MDDLTRLRASVARTVMRAQERTSPSGGPSEAPTGGVGAARPRASIEVVLAAEERACLDLERRIAATAAHRRAVDARVQRLRLRAIAVEQEIGITQTAMKVARRRRDEQRRRARALEVELRDAFEERKRMATAVLETEEVFARISGRLRSLAAEEGSP